MEKNAKICVFLDSGLIKIEKSSYFSCKYVYLKKITKKYGKNITKKNSFKS